jgi:hypothetical protein
VAVSHVMLAAATLVVYMGLATCVLWWIGSQMAGRLTPKAAR